MPRNHSQKSVKIALLTDESYASCPVWRGLVRTCYQDVVALERETTGLAKIFPDLESVWYKPAAATSDAALIAHLQKILESNPDSHVVLCLHAGESERLEAFYSLGVHEIIFIDECTGDSQALNRLLISLQQRRLHEARHRAAQLAMKLAWKNKSESLVWLSHEIRTPMNGLLGMMELLQNTGLSDEQLELLEVMTRCGQNLLALVSDVLDMNKLEANKMQVQKSNFSLKRLIDDSLHLYERDAKKHGVAIRCVIAAEVPEFVHGDQRKLAQILNNLLSNAVKYTKKGSIKVAVKLDNREDDTLVLKFEIKDSGFGISEEQLPNVFAAFEQTDSSSLTKVPSTGIGMNLTKQLVELMGGTIELNSVLGKGTTFSVRLPFGIVLATKKTVAKELPLTAATYGSNKRILVVDDDPMNLSVAKRQLKRFAAQVHVASSGVEALELLEKQSFDLIFLDCQMPHMDGSELLRIVRQLPTAPIATPIIALTALARAEDRTRILAEGFDDYLSKPAQLEDIAQILEKWLSRSKSEKLSA